MARNIEIKARLENFDAVYKRAAALADGAPVTITQDDTFFCCDNGRLKLRTLSAEKAELIFYRRPDQKGLRESFYVIANVTDPDGIREALTLAYGKAGRVRKKRILFLAGRTRIHLDRVEGLGEFLELEVPLEEGQDAEASKAVAQDLLDTLGIRPHQFIDTSYVDLIDKAQQTILVSGTIKRVRRFTTKKDQPMAVAEATVEGNTIELIIFTETYLQSAELLRKGSSVNIELIVDDSFNSRYIVKSITGNA